MLKYLNAVNYIVKGKAETLHELEEKYQGDWKLAWRKIGSPRFGEAGNSEIKPDQAWDQLWKEKILMITIRDSAFPPALKQIFDPPYLLYVRGQADALKNECFSIVGTRALSDYGKRASRDLGAPLARAGFTLVSGLARGIDSEVHKVALEENAPTISVLGCGVSDKVLYPQSNLNLAHRIIDSGGAIISEYPIDMRAQQYTFPQRNRIISGMSKGVLVVEGDIKSGTMITAKSALDQNRDVFAVPGSI